MKILILVLTLLTFSCTISFVNPKERTVGYDQSIRNLACEKAKAYIGMPYLYGGDDRPRAYGIDCSGLVINAYEDALKGTTYSLPFGDATADNMFKNFSRTVSDPGKGDLIFFLDPEGRAYHVGILLKKELDRYYFIDSTLIENLGIDGVTERSLSTSTTLRVVIKRLVLLGES